MFKKMAVILFTTMLVLCLASIIPGASLAEPPVAISGSGWMCEQCFDNFDSWWCAGCLGLTHQQYYAMLMY